MIVMGRIAAPFGVRGWLKVYSFTAQPAALLDYPRWWIASADDEDADWRELRIAETRVQGKALMVRPEGCADRTQAQAWRGMRIAVPKRELPQAAPGEYYWTDLIGLQVVNRQGADFGVVGELMATGANDVLVVRGERERLIPFIASVIVAVDLAAGRVTVDWGADY
jgi:16S rRNA processing protein RimM